MREEYDDELEKSMIALYESLSEKDRRRYAAVEAQRIGYGGASYVPTLFGCDPKTIKRGMKELGDEEEMRREGVRVSGGGPKSKLDSIEGIDEVFLEVLRLNTAGDPMKEAVKWTHLSRAQIIKEMGKKGIKVAKYRQEAIEKT